MGAEEKTHTNLKRYVESGDRIRKARQHKGIKREELADAIHCSPGLIASMEQGVRALRYENAVSIAQICGVRVEWLFTGSEPMTEKEAIQAIIGKLKILDVMWTEFIKHIALRSGYEMKECENGHPAKDETMVIDTETPYLSFENGSDSYDFTIRDTNIFIDDISRYAELRLKMMLERKKGE